MTSSEAREAAWVEFRGNREPRFIQSRLAYEAGVEWGIAEGIRQAREAVAGRLADPAVSSSPAVLGVVDALAAIDALGEADRG